MDRKAEEVSERRTKTFEVEYTFYHPGEKVKLYGDSDVYEVEKTSEPLYAGDQAVVHLKGRKFGVTTEEIERLIE